MTLATIENLGYAWFGREVRKGKVGQLERVCK